MLVTLAVALTVVLSLAPVPTRAAFPGPNGPIAFEGGSPPEIYSVQSNGSGRVNLTNHPAQDVSPAWSSDGRRIVFVSDRDGNDEIYVMNADGGDQTRLTDSSDEDIDPAFSPDGTKITFTSRRDGNREIYVMDADGDNPTRLTTNPEEDPTRRSPRTAQRSHSTGCEAPIPDQTSRP
jgi:Tol biopolymer transport system component